MSSPDPIRDLERFQHWAFGFEGAFWSDDFAALRPLLAAEAVHTTDASGPLAANDRGPEAVLAGLRASVHALDRRFDTRIPEILEGPSTRAGGVWMRYLLRLRRAGLPELAFEGEHLTRYADGSIVAIEESLPAGAGERVAAYLREHDARLRPAASPPAPPADPRDLRDAEAALHRSLVRCYASAKSEGDVGAALAVCAEDFVLDAVPLGIPSADRRGAEAQLRAFFSAFPDYAVRSQGMVAEGGAVACWGSARQTFRGAYLGFAPTGRSMALPFTSVFEARGGRLTRERYFFDLATLCAGIGLPLAEVQDTLAKLRSTAEAAA